MNILFYTILFIVGIIVGCFWAIEAEELPRKVAMKKIYYDNNSNEVIVSRLTYIVIGGLTSVVLANIFNINLHEIDMFKITIYIFAMLYISTLVLIAGIDKMYLKIEKTVLAFGIISSIIYMLYLCMTDATSIYMNGIYLSIYLILLIIDAFLLRKYAKDSYIINTLILLMIIVVFLDWKILILSMVLAIVSITIYMLINIKLKKKNGNKKFKINEIPIGYFISASNIIVLFMTRFLENYYI